MKVLKNLLIDVLKVFNLKIVKNDFFVELDNERKLTQHNLKQLEFIFLNDRVKKSQKLYDLLKFSKSQISQDLFVINEFDYIEDGYFVEIGAADGLNLSNTYMLEKNFNWKGVVVEPAKVWRKKLLENRNCTISNDCIYSESGLKVDFLQTVKPEFSTLNIKNKPKDIHENFRKKNNTSYVIETISFKNFAKKYNIPNKINYISIDTEGTEYEILKSIDLKKYDIKIFTIEHNYSTNRDLIYKYLTKFGYVRVLESFSDFDDCYVKSD